jgi:hypothetical protein
MESEKFKHLLNDQQVNKNPNLKKNLENLLILNSLYIFSSTYISTDT